MIRFVGSRVLITVPARLIKVINRDPSARADPVPQPPQPPQPPQVM